MVSDRMNIYRKYGRAPTPSETKASRDAAIKYLAKRGHEAGIQAKKTRKANKDPLSIFVKAINKCESIDDLTEIESVIKSRKDNILNNI